MRGVSHKQATTTPYVSRVPSLPHRDGDGGAGADGARRHSIVWGFTFPHRSVQRAKGRKVDLALSHRSSDIQSADQPGRMLCDTLDSACNWDDNRFVMEFPLVSKPKRQEA
eukprot:8537011-Pyramimonas_sp.AAC.2